MDVRTRNSRTRGRQGGRQLRGLAGNAAVVPGAAAVRLRRLDVAGLSLNRHHAQTLDGGKNEADGQAGDGEGTDHGLPHIRACCLGTIVITYTFVKSGCSIKVNSEIMRRPGEPRFRPARRTHYRRFLVVAEPALPAIGDASDDHRDEDHGSAKRGDFLSMRPAGTAPRLRPPRPPGVPTRRASPQPLRP